MKINFTKLTCIMGVIRLKSLNLINAIRGLALAREIIYTNYINHFLLRKLKFENSTLFLIVTNKIYSKCQTSINLLLS